MAERDAKEFQPADRGRDIICDAVRTDIDGAVELERWFVDCKHFKKGVPPTELQNLLSWAEAERPHVALFCVSGFLSNPSKEYLEVYRRTRHPTFKIKVWERPRLERFARRRLRLLRKYGLTELPIRSTHAILKAEEEFEARVWYDRKQMMFKRVADGQQTYDKEILKSVNKYCRELEKKYGKKSMGPYSDFEWGMVNGKLSALRWVLGYDWDMLDT